MNLRRLVRRLGLVNFARFVLLRLLVMLYPLLSLGVIKYSMIGHDWLIQMGNAALARSKHKLAIEVYIAALALEPEDNLLRRQIGIATYLAGEYQECEKWFASTELSRHFDLSRWGLAHSQYRVLDGSWLLAIGHITFLDIYIKAARLGWMPTKNALLAYNPLLAPAGWPMFRYFSEHVRILPSSKPSDAIDEIVHGEDFRELDQDSRDAMRAALSHPFWYGQDESKRTRMNAPYGAAVQAAWKAAGHAPLLSPSTDDRLLFRRRMHEIYGLPEDVWFVLLHVREPGYHAAWHRHHPATRNADIRTYGKVFDFILSQGGWVVRGGDPTMTKIQPRDHVIDYATSSQRSPEIDVLLCAECSYLVGTNSGFSLIPPIFGKRCALTNWSPVAVPNWYLDDIYIPKLVRRRGSNKCLSFTELFSSFAGWSQFQRDFRKSALWIEDNTPDDLLATVQELHAEVFGDDTEITAEDESRLSRFNEIAVSHGGYVGSRMSYRFLAKYPQLLE